MSLFGAAKLIITNPRVERNSPLLLSRGKVERRWGWIDNGNVPDAYSRSLPRPVGPRRSQVAPGENYATG